jgi:iron(III) transport system substrate-binding protein
MREQGRLPVIFAIVMLVAACDANHSEKPGLGQALVVYAPEELEEGLVDWYADSGFAVTIVTGESTALADKVINKLDVPKADVLITSNILDIWRAGDQGALRPIQGDALKGVPAVLKDPDRTWVAYGHHRLVVAVAQQAGSTEGIDFQSLGSTEMAGKLCLSSSQLPINRMLVGMLIEELGARPAERLVRGWVRNLAQAPYASRGELVAALKRGDCMFGIVSSRDDLETLSLLPTNPTYVAIDGIGISRHAQHPDAAQALVSWMLSTYQPGELNGSVASNIGIAGWRAEDARLLAERAGYR